MKRQKKEPKQGDWMGTYGDMVTLLLCFFILLYAISSVDQQKWEILVKSFNPKASEVTQVVTDQDIEVGKDDVKGAMEQPDTVEEFENLFYTLEEAIKSQELESDVQLTKGDGYTFVNFNDLVFFDGNSPVLLEEGKKILKSFGNALGQVDGAIQQIKVLGHTSRADPNLPNEVHTDRVLSAQRSAEVVAYLQENSTPQLTPSKLVSLGFGEYWPVATFDTPEGRAKNRRVEILITQSDTVEKSLSEYYEQIYQQ